jgi:hypothetical protein
LEKKMAENMVEQNRRIIEDNVREAQIRADDVESDLADAPDTWDLSDRIEICQEAISAIERLRGECCILSDTIPDDGDGFERRESAFADMLEKVNRIQSQLESGAESDEMDDEDTQKRTMTANNLFAKSELFYINAKNITATGYEVEDGFVVCKGSQAVAKETESIRVRFKNIMRIRKELIEQGILAKGQAKGVLVFTKDHTLTSANIAANVVLGYSGNLERWKDENGTSLKKFVNEKKGRSISRGRRKLIEVEKSFSKKT